MALRGRLAKLLAITCGPTRAVGLGLWLCGCATTSLHGDVRAVEDLVHERAAVKKLKLPALPSTSNSERAALDPEAKRLLDAPLTAESAIRIALLNSRSLRAQLLDLGVGRGQLVASSVFPNPEFDAAVRFSEQDDTPPVWDLGLSIDITRILLRGSTEEIAQAELDATRIRVAGATLDLALEARLGFYALQHAEQRVALQKTAFEAFSASFETARALYEAGNINALDLATEEAACEGARADLSQAEAQRMNAREQLALILGTFDRELRTTGKLAEPASEVAELNVLEKHATEASLELAEARAKMIAGERRVGLAEDSGSLPELHLGVSAERDDRAWAVGPALSGSLPLFDQNLGGTISARAALGAQRERYAALHDAVRSAMRVAREHAISARARATHYRDTLLPLREKVLRETLLHYNAMHLSVFQLLQARRDQIATSLTYLDTLHEYWRARAEIDQLLAGRRMPSTSAPSHAASASASDTQPSRMSDAH